MGLYMPKAIGLYILPKAKKPNPRRAKSVNTPMDIGDPAKARAVTLKWLDEDGPPPAEHMCLLFPDDTERVERLSKKFFVSPDQTVERLSNMAIRTMLEFHNKNISKERVGMVAMRQKAAAEALMQLQEFKRLEKENEALKPKAKIHGEIVKGASKGGKENAKRLQKKQQQWHTNLLDHYRNQPLTHHMEYQAEAQRLQRIKHKYPELASIPSTETLRKYLGTLLRALFPNLY